MDKKVDILKSKNYNEFLKTQLKLNKNVDTRKSSRYKKIFQVVLTTGLNN